MPISGAEGNTVVALGNVQTAVYLKTVKRGKSHCRSIKALLHENPMGVKTNLRKYIK